MTKKYMLGSLLLFILSACKGEECSLPIKASFGTVIVANIKYTKAQEDCIIKEISNLLSDIDEGKIDPYKNKISKHHSIVEDIRKNGHIEVDRKGLHHNVLIPIDENSLRVVLYKNDDYALYGMHNKNFQQNLGKCFQNQEIYPTSTAQ